MLEVESQWAGYQLQLAAEQEEQAAQQAAVAYQIGTRQEAAARAAFWRLWKTPYERVKRVRPANQTFLNTHTVLPGCNGRSRVRGWTTHIE